MKHTLKGVIYSVDSVKEISQSFKKREFILKIANEKDSNWDDYIRLQLVQGNVDLIDELYVGRNVEVSFNINGKKWLKDGKEIFFNTLTVWSISLI